ncbi:MAG: hypothetical protein WCS95_10110, partial [Lentisphaeria bacterium]
MTYSDICALKADAAASRLEAGAPTSYPSHVFCPKMRFSCNFIEFFCFVRFPFHNKPKQAGTAKALSVSSCLLVSSPFMCLCVHSSKKRILGLLYSWKSSNAPLVA